MPGGACIVKSVLNCFRKFKKLLLRCLGMVCYYADVDLDGK